MMSVAWHSDLETTRDTHEAATRLLHQETDSFTALQQWIEGTCTTIHLAHLIGLARAIDVQSSATPELRYQLILRLLQKAVREDDVTFPILQVITRSQEYTFMQKVRAWKAYFKPAGRR